MTKWVKRSFTWRSTDSCVVIDEICFLGVGADVAYIQLRIVCRIEYYPPPLGVVSRYDDHNLKLVKMLISIPCTIWFETYDSLANLLVSLS